MTCRVCGQVVMEMPKNAGDVDHHLMRSPIFSDVCLGCWIAGVQLETFLFRSGAQVPMGPWVDGWLREMIADPRRYM